MIATDKGDPEWDTLVARTIRAMKSDGTLTRISLRWFGTDITGDEN
jgi:polar amino acid transport system substrate-binding protein